MRIAISTTLILVLRLSVLSASAEMPILQLYLAQDILIPGEDLWYSAVLSGDREPSKSAIVHVTLYSIDGILHFRKSYRSTDGVISDFTTLPYDIGQGTFVLSADIYDSTGQEVLLESSRLIHVVGDDPAATYYDLQARGELRVISLESSKSAIERKMKTRDDICQDIDGDHLVIASAQPLLRGAKMLCYSEDNRVFQSEFSVSFSIENKQVRPFIFSPQDNLILSLSYQEKSGLYRASLPDDFLNREIQLIDAYSFAPILGALIVDPEPKWFSCEKTPKTINISEVILKQSESRGLIGRAFNNTGLDSIVERPSGSEVDIPEDEFVLSDYQTFESLELFIKEVVTPIKLNRQKGKVDIQLVDKENRRFYSGEPLFIVDGRVVSTIEDMLAVPFVEIDRLSMIRSSEFLDKSFGIYGRNGVLRLFTKQADFGDDLIVLPALSPLKFYSNVDNNSTTSTHPNFSSLQFMGIVDSNFCYNHNDELGPFVVQLIDVNTGERKLSSYHVELGRTKSINSLKD